MTNEIEMHGQDQVLVTTDVVVELVETESVGVLVEVALQGPPGPAGPGLRITGAVASISNLPAAGSDGDLLLIEDTKHAFAWADGLWRDIGPIGIPGPAGKDGQIKYTGTGEPGVILGAHPGDTYMDLTTGTIYKLQ